MSIDNLQYSIRYEIGRSDLTKRSFEFPFEVLESGHVKVVLGDGTELNGFNVMLNQNTKGGTVHFYRPFKEGEIVIIYRSIPILRNSKFLENEDFLAESINKEFDRIIMLLQQANKASLSGIRQSISDEPSNLILPDKSQRLNKIVSFDENGDLKLITEGYEALNDLTENVNESKRYYERSQNYANLAAAYFNEVRGLLNNIDYRKKFFDAINNLSDLEKQQFYQKIGLKEYIDDKLKDESIKSSPIGTKLYLDRSTFLISKNSNGEFREGIDKRKVWTLEEQKAMMGGRFIPRKDYVELPSNRPVRFRFVGPGVASNRTTWGAYTRIYITAIEQSTNFPPYRGIDTLYRARGSITYANVKPSRKNVTADCLNINSVQFGQAGRSDMKSSNGAVGERTLFIRENVNFICEIGAEPYSYSPTVNGNGFSDEAPVAGENGSVIVEY